MTRNVMSRMLQDKMGNWEGRRKLMRLTRRFIKGSDHEGMRDLDRQFEKDRKWLLQYGVGQGKTRASGMTTGGGTRAKSNTKGSTRGNDEGRWWGMRGRLVRFLGNLTRIVVTFWGKKGRKRGGFRGSIRGIRDIILGKWCWGLIRSSRPRRFRNERVLEKVMTSARELT